jgi:SNF2 family DNA or RNA helicase
MDRIKPAVFLLENEEYKDQLPPVHYVEMKCELPDREPYEKMKRDFVLELGGTQITAVTAGVVSQKLTQMSSGFIYCTESVASDRPGKWDTTKTATWLSTHKFDLLDELLEENQHANTIIFYNYQEEFAELKRRYPHSQTLDDKNAVSRWNDGQIELLLAHPKSAQFGLNLQFGGSKMVFLSLPWSLIDFEQAVGRLHRSGQKHAVWVYVLLTKNTIDERIWKALHEKRSLAEVAIDELKGQSAT